MVRIASASSALLIAASVLTLSNAKLLYKVRVRNLTYMQPFSTIGLLAHDEELGGYELSEPATPQLRAVAEDGDLSVVMALALTDDVAPFVCALTAGSGELEPGGEEWITLEVDEENCPNGVWFTMVAKLLNTNDGFVGIDSMKLDPSSSTTVFPPGLDAGTEQNNELCTHVPGPACSATSGNAEATPGEGYIHIHRGIQGVGDLSAADYDWKNPVAEVFISKPVKASAAPGDGYIHIHRGIQGVGDLSAAAYDWKNPVAKVFISKPVKVYNWKVLNPEIN